MRLYLKNLISVREWQGIQNKFANITGVALQTFDSQGKPVTKASNLPRLCAKITKKTPLKNTLCPECLPSFLGGRGVVDKNLGYTCLIEGMQINNFIVPLKLNDADLLGYIHAGPLILVMRKPKEEYQKIAEQLNIDLEALWSALLEIRVMSYQGVQSLIDFIREIGEYVLQLAYSNIVTRSKDNLAESLSKFAKIFDTLLDVAFEISKADIGSVMFLEKDNETLTIRASRGIPQEVVDKTSVKLGDGIAGISAKEERAFLIDDNLRDKRIKRYLTRSDIISSSLVLPLKLRNQVLGVMNLASLRTSPVKLSDDSLNSIQKLINLTALAAQ